MILLIGGSSHVGKTLLSQKLLEKYHYPCTSLDHLKMGLIRAGITELTPEQDDEMREYLWPIAAEMVKTAIENDQNMILEGCYIPGDWASLFNPEYLKEIRCVFLVMTEAYIRTHEREIVEKGSVIERRLHSEVNIDRLVRCSAWFKELALEYGTPYVEIDGEYDIDRIMDEAEERLKLK